jgi:hypothetical protein
MANAIGSFHSLVPPMTTKINPTAQPSNTFMRRLLKIRTASFTWGSEAATIEAMAQIGFSSSAMCVSTYQVTVVPIKTFTANLTPMMSRWSEMSHVVSALFMGVAPIVAQTSSFLPRSRAVTVKSVMTKVQRRRKIGSYHANHALGRFQVVDVRHRIDAQGHDRFAHA